MSEAEYKTNSQALTTPITLTLTCLAILKWLTRPPVRPAIATQFPQLLHTWRWSTVGSANVSDQKLILNSIAACHSMHGSDRNLCAIEAQLTS